MIRVIDGCEHAFERMIEWAENGACPVCLTAESGMLKEQLAKVLARLKSAEAAVAAVNKADHGLECTIDHDAYPKGAAVCPKELCREHAKRFAT